MGSGLRHCRSLYFGASPPSPLFEQRQPCAIITRDEWRHRILISMILIRLRPGTIST
jgi:hypothetical protein